MTKIIIEFEKLTLFEEFFHVYAYLCKKYIDDMDLIDINDKDYSLGFKSTMNEVPVVLHVDF